MFRIWVMTATGKAISTGVLDFKRLNDTLEIAQLQIIEYIIYEG